MYRHFAVVTLIITAGLAMFANGEQTRAVAAQVAAKQNRNGSAQQQNQVRLAAVRRDNMRDARGSGGGSATDFDAGDGMIDPDGLVADPAGSRPPMLGPGGPVQRVPDAATYKMTPTEYERLRALQRKGKGSPATAPTPEQLRAASEASARRSGSDPASD